MKDPLNGTLKLVAETVIKNLCKIIANHAISQHNGAYTFTDEEKHILDDAAYLIEHGSGKIVCTHRDEGYCGECYRKAMS